MNLEDEWTLANVIDAAVDEQRRRLGQDPLPPRDDDPGGLPRDTDPRRWPGVCENWASVSGRDLANELSLQDTDLWTIVVNTYDSLKSRFGSQNVAIGANALLSCTTGSQNIAFGASTLATPDNSYTVVDHNATFKPR